MYGRSRVPEEVEPRSTFTRGLSYIASVLFTRVDLRAYARKSYETVDIHCNTWPIFKVLYIRWGGSVAR